MLVLASSVPTAPSVLSRTCFAAVASVPASADAPSMTQPPDLLPLSGAAAMGLPMMLFLQAFEPSNVYSGQYTFSGLGVAARDSARFFQDRFSELVRTSRLSALTLDGVQDIWYSNLTRLAVVGEQDLYDKGLADAALQFKLPIRIDQELPGDILASVQYGINPSCDLTAVAPVLFAVTPLLFAITPLLFAVTPLLFGVTSLLFAVTTLLTAVTPLWCTVTPQWFAVTPLLFAVKPLLLLLRHCCLLLSHCCCCYATVVCCYATVVCRKSDDRAMHW